MAAPPVCAELITLVTEYIAQVTAVIDDSHAQLLLSRNLKTEISTNLKANFDQIKHAAAELGSKVANQVKRISEKPPAESEDSVQAAVEKITSLLERAIDAPTEERESQSAFTTVVSKKNKNKNKKKGDVKNGNRVSGAAATAGQAGPSRRALPSFAEMVAAPARRLAAQSNGLRPQINEFPPLPAPNHNSGIATARTSASSGQQTSIKGNSTASTQPRPNNNMNREKSSNGVILRSTGGADPFEVLKANVDPTADGVGITFAKKLPGNRVFVACADQEGLAALKVKLTGQLDPVVKTKHHPQVIIHNVPQSFTDDQVLRAVQLATNEAPLLPLKVSNYKNKTDVKFVICTLSPAAWSKILQHGKLFVSWVVCPVKNNVSIIRCTKCYMYGHTTKYCRAEAQVVLEVNNCINCQRYNQKLQPNQQSRDFAHSTFDRNCESLRRHVASNIRNTSYEPRDGGHQ